jgi:hypothetical protein
MKTITQLTLIGLTTALLATGGAFANDSEWATFQSGNARVTYRRPAHNEATVALHAHGQGIGRAIAKAKDGELRFEHFPTTQGAVSYFAPAE